MALKIFKSYTKSTRGTVLINREKLWKGKSLKSLTGRPNKDFKDFIIEAEGFYLLFFDFSYIP